MGGGWGVPSAGIVAAVAVTVTRRDPLFQLDDLEAALPLPTALGGLGRFL
jgi:hypothetical protein